MTIGTFIKKQNLEKTLLVGYYGGGNFGDELLLEVLLNLFKKQGIKQLEIDYMGYAKYETYHHDFGYKTVPATNILQQLLAISRNKNLVVGGGGIWGLDARKNVLLMSAMLVLARLLGKNVYLLGVGYYSSTTKIGHVSAWLAAKASRLIIARDQETLRNFKRLNPHTELDTDIAWYLKNLDLSVYEKDLAALEANISVTGKTLFVTLRRFAPKHANEFSQIVSHCLAQNQDKKIVVGILEKASLDTISQRLLETWQRIYKNVVTVELAYNPLALVLFLQKHQKNLAVISPQFHMLLCAHLSGVPFMPLVYDNKSQQLLERINHPAPLSIYDLTAEDAQAFIDQFCEEPS